MASTGPIPKCSFVGVYKSARVDRALRSAERCAVVKFNRMRMSGLIAVQLNGGMLVGEEEGEMML